MSLQQQSNLIATIGECMLEYHGDLLKPPTFAAEAIGGDTLNVAVYLARQHIPVDFVTQLGNDNQSQWMRQQWQQQSVGTIASESSDRQSGAYGIAVDECGASRFTYWREQSAARQLFSPNQNTRRLLHTLSEYHYLFVSGISLAILTKSALQQLFSFLHHYRQNGGTVVFDSNYRPSLWDSREQAQTVCRQMYGLTDIALPSLYDEQSLFGDKHVAAVIKRLQQCGVKEIALKMASAGCKVVSPNNVSTVACKPVSEVVDNTAAGDAFNAGYIAARLIQKTTIEAAQQGHTMAAPTLKHLGAITPA